MYSANIFRKAAIPAKRKAEFVLCKVVDSLVVQILNHGRLAFLLLADAEVGLSKSNEVECNERVGHKCKKGAKPGLVYIAALIENTYRLPKDVLVHQE